LQAEKLLTGTLPYPFTSKEVFEQSIRMPIGPEFNPATAVRALNRPEVSDFLTNPHSYILMINFDCSFLDVEGLCIMKNLTSLAKMHLCMLCFLYISWMLDYFAATIL
jgi:hypothetical protein